MATDQSVEILLVEYHPNDVKLALRALKKHNLDKNVFVVKDGAEALDFIFAKGAYAHRSIENIPKIVFLDLKLPKVSGLEVLKKIKEDKRTRLIPVVMLTSSKEEEDIMQGYEYGASSYVVKPVDFD